MINYGAIVNGVYRKHIDYNKAVIWKFRELSIHPLVVEKWFPAFPVESLQFIDTMHDCYYEIPYKTFQSICEKKKVGQEEQYYFSIAYLKKQPLPVKGGVESTSTKEEGT